MRSLTLLNQHFLGDNKELTSFFGFEESSSLAVRPCEPLFLVAQGSDRGATSPGFVFGVVKKLVRVGWALPTCNRREEVGKAHEKLASLTSLYGKRLLKNAHGNL